MSICWQKEGREKEGQGGREGGREGGKKGARKRRKKEREGGWQQLLTLHLLLCSRVEFVCFRKPPSPAPLWQASIVQSYGTIRNQNVPASFYVIEKQILTFFFFLSVGTRTPILKGHSTIRGVERIRSTWSFLVPRQHLAMSTYAILENLTFPWCCLFSLKFSPCPLCCDGKWLVNLPVWLTLSLSLSLFLLFYYFIILFF